MTTRCKFRCHNKVPHDWGTVIELSPIYSDDPNSENKVFWDSTPAGHLSMTIKTVAADMFEVGVEYYLDISRAP